MIILTPPNDHHRPDPARGGACVCGGTGRVRVTFDGIELYPERHTSEQSLRALAATLGFSATYSLKYLKRGSESGADMAEVPMFKNLLLEDGDSFAFVPPCTF